LDLIKERLYYTIGEVSSILELQPSTIRYWEKHFPVLKLSRRTGTSKRKFDLKDIQTLFRIKGLLKNDKVSIKKAQIILEGWKAETGFDEFNAILTESKRPEVTIPKEKLSKMNEIVSDIKKLLSSIN